MIGLTIGAIVSNMSAIVTGIGAQKVMTTVANKLIEPELQKQILVKIGIYSLTGVASAAAANFVGDKVTLIFNALDKAQDKMNERLNKEESKK